MDFRDLSNCKKQSGFKYPPQKQLKEPLNKSIRLWRTLYKKLLNKIYFDFTGVATRAEYLACFLNMYLRVHFYVYAFFFIRFALYFFIERRYEYLKPYVVVLSLTILAIILIYVFLVAFTISVGRLHDIGYSGWWLVVIIFLTATVPFTVTIFIFLGCIKSKYENNKYRIEYISNND